MKDLLITLGYVIAFFIGCVLTAKGIDYYFKKRKK